MFAKWPRSSIPEMYLDIIISKRYYSTMKAFEKGQRSGCQKRARRKFPNQKKAPKRI